MLVKPEFVNQSEISKRFFHALKETQQSHSKVHAIKYESHDIQEYLTSRNISNEHCKLLFKLRSKTSKHKMNFPNRYQHDMESMQCPHNCQEPPAQDTPEHQLMCPALQSVWLSPQTKEQPEHSHIYGNVEQQTNIASTFFRLMELREKLTGNSD